MEEKKTLTRQYNFEEKNKYGVGGVACPNRYQDAL